MLTPLTLTLFILGAFLFIQLSIDGIRSRRTKKVRQRLFAIGREQSLTSISVIVKARRHQTDVITLLDQLRVHAYPKLEVVVIPHDRTNKRKSAYLRDYQAKHPDLKLRMVSSANKLTAKRIATSYSHGELIFWLECNQPLPPRFFNYISYEFTDPSLRCLTIPYVTRLSKTFTSSLVAWSGIRRQTLRLITGKNYDQQLRVDRRASFKASQTTGKRGPLLPLVIHRDYTQRKRRDWPSVISNVTLTSLILYSLFLVQSSPWIFAVAACITVYILANTLWMLSIRGYSFLQKVLLLIALPFAIIGIAPNEDK